MLNTFNGSASGSASDPKESRRAERERQIAIMDNLIHDFEKSAGGGGPDAVFGSGNLHDRRRSSLTGGGSDGSEGPAPSGTIENARKFLWDEDQDMVLSGGGSGLSSSGDDPHHLSLAPSLATPSSLLAGSVSGSGSSKYRADTTNSYTAALGESISIMGPSLYDAPGYGVGTSGSSGRMPGRGSSSDDLHFHESAYRVGVHSMHSERSGGGTGETAAQRRTPADFTQVFSKVNPLEGIRARITMPFRGFGSKNIMDSFNSKSNIAPRRPSGSDDEFADMIDMRASGPGQWAEETSRTIRDGLGRASYVISDCCESTGRAAKRRKGTLLLVAAAALIVIVATSVGTAVQRDGGAASSSSTSASRSPPKAPDAAAAPEVGAATSEHDGPRTSFGTIVGTNDKTSRFGSMRRRVLESGLSHESDLNNADSAQRKALKWIADMDGAALDPKDHGMLQRYALAVFFFSTFLSSELPDVESLKNLADQPVTAVGEGWKDRTNWLTSKGYCTWAGVQCHHRDGTSPSNTVYDGNDGVAILNLTANHIEGTIPREIKGFGDLRVLDLGDNLIEGTLPPEIGDLEALQMLYLDGNGLEGAIPMSMGKLTHAIHIYMDNNYLDGPIPEELSGLANLRILALHRNSLTGTLPHLNGLVHLQDLYLDSNYITGEIPSSLSELTNLNDLRLGNNELTGSVPLRLCELENLSVLYLEENFLGGAIMECIGSMKSLAELQLYGNRISGTIPEAIGELSALEILYIDNNELEGSLPSSLSKLESLVALYAQTNELTGQIPQELSALSNLQRLYLHENKLEGQVPAQLGALKRLQKIRLHGNNLSGQVPLDVCMLKDHALIDLQGDCAAGKLECECCTQCH